MPGTISRSRSAFTLTELLTVVSIIIILLAMGVGYSTKVQESKTNQEMETFSGAIEGMSSMAKKAGFLKCTGLPTFTDTDIDTTTPETISGNDDQLLTWEILENGRVVKEGVIHPNGRAQLGVIFSNGFKKCASDGKDGTTKVSLEVGVCANVYSGTKSKRRNKRLFSVIYNPNGTPVCPGKIELVNYRGKGKVIRRLTTSIARDGGIRREVKSE